MVHRCVQEGGAHRLLLHQGHVHLPPLCYAIWENIQAELDKRFKETGHENVYLPLLIPESLLQKEKDHVEASPPSAPG